MSGGLIVSPPKITLDWHKTHLAMFCVWGAGPVFCVWGAGPWSAAYYRNWTTVLCLGCQTTVLYMGPQAPDQGPVPYWCPAPDRASPFSAGRVTVAPSSTW